MKKRQLKHVKIENISGYQIKIAKHIVLKKHHYFVVDKNVGGDAPKEFIKVYEYGKVRKSNKRNWIGYIAKTGQKWYPAESATEYLLNQIGESLGLDIAHSRLAYIGGQVRFMSRYFLKKDEILVHSAEIFAGYLSGDKSFVEEVEKRNMARNLFTFQFAESAIKAMFPAEHIAITDEFVKLLIFDAIVGNNDRHIYNWAVITNVSGNKRPVFSPIYDTARGLFWNESLAKLNSMLEHPKQLSERLTRYAINSKT